MLVRQGLHNVTARETQQPSESMGFCCMCTCKDVVSAKRGRENWQCLSGGGDQLRITRLVAGNVTDLVMVASNNHFSNKPISDNVPLVFMLDTLLVGNFK